MRPFLSSLQAAGASDRAAGRIIFVILFILFILSILSILSPAVPGPVAMPTLAMALGD